MEIFETVKNIIVETCSINGSIITPDATMENIGVDSLDVVDVISAIEEQYSIKISDDEIEQIETVQDIVDIVEKLAQ